MTEKIESSLKAPKFKMDDKIMITKYKNNFSKYYTNIWSIETPMMNFVLKANSWTHKIKDLNGEILVGSFYEKELLLSKL